MPSTPDIARVVEKQMRNWELAHAQQPAPAATAPPSVQAFVAISRQVGSGGSAVAAALGERLGWPVLGNAILQAMAGDDQVRERLYRLLDERDESWLHEMLRWILRGEFRRDDYFHRLTETILALARRGKAVFVGRGADLILPPDRGLRVRIVAPLDVRVRAFAAREGVTEAKAREEVERIGRERLEFIRNHFHRDADDATRSDLVLNTERLGVAEVVEVLVAALQQRRIAV